MEAARRAARVLRSEGARRAADRLRAALQRRFRLLVPREVEDQERTLPVLGLGGREHLPAGLQSGIRQLECERRLAGDDHRALAGGGRRRAGRVWGGGAGRATLRVLVVATAGLAPMTAGGHSADRDRR